MATVDDLPDELLEHVLSLISPYNDLKSCKLVSRKWHVTVKRVIKRRLNDLSRAIKSNNIRWQTEKSLNISLRHSHAACCVDGTMYVFGGCSSTDTTFNDLLALDLNVREFNRVSVRGTIPSPKACATLCNHKGNLILFGGWAHPSRIAPYQTLILFNELHSFDIASKTWTSHTTQCPELSFASHSATVHGDTMVVFGGVTGSSQISWSNKISCLDLNEMKWTYPECSEDKPYPRFGQSQIYLDETHLMIIGGSKGTGFPRVSCDDVWFLRMGDLPWEWRPITVINPQWAAPHLWCHPVVKFGDIIVAFSRCASDDLSFSSISSDEGKPTPETPKEENVNGKHGCFLRHHAGPSGPVIHNLDMVPGGRPIIPLRDSRRERQLAALAKFEKMFNPDCKKKEQTAILPPRMNLYVADIRDVTKKGVITWLPPRYSGENPFDRILYSLVVGNSELIMLGGIATDGELGVVACPKVVQYHPLSFAMAPKNLL